MLVSLSSTDLFEQLKPKYIAPVVAYLCHESCEENGGIFEAAGGWVGKYRWSRAQGKAFIPPDNLTIESVKANWSQITDMQNSSMPASVHGKCVTHSSTRHWQVVSLIIILLLLQSSRYLFTRTNGLVAQFTFWWTDPHF